MLALRVLWPAAAEAQTGQIRLLSDAPYALLVNGEEIKAFPIVVDSGSRACVTTTVDHINEKERRVFTGWSNGPKDICITVTEPGDYIAEYTREVLVEIRSALKTYRTSAWVSRGESTRLAVLPEVEERPGVRYLFEEWTAGESPFSPDNLITLNRPMTVEVRWTKEYYLGLEGPEDVRLVGFGWHVEGKNVVLKAPPTAFSPGEDERRQFLRWEVVSNPAIVIPNARSPVTSFRIDDAHTLLIQQFRVLRMEGNPLQGVQICLGLREPLQLEDVLGKMRQVSEVVAIPLEPGQDGEVRDRLINVQLGKEPQRGEA